MKKKFFLPLLVALPLCGFARECETYQYGTNDGKALYLDHYRGDSLYAGPRPCVIFVFPGGFAMGDKADKRALSYFEWLCTEGYDVVSIDYRLGMSKVYDNYGWKKGYSGVVQRMKTAVRWATEDLLTATNFVLKKAAAWNVNPKQLIACGSSAGAITCLQAENILCGGDTLARRVPSSFNYAGVISFAGAIFSTKGAPKWRKKPCPILLFHGNSDGNVPYRKAQVFGIGFYGSAYLVEQFQERGSAYTFYDADYRTHELAITPMDHNRAEILEFLMPMAYKYAYGTSIVNNPELTEKTTVDPRPLTVADFQPATTLQQHKHIHDRSIRKRQTKFSLKEYLKNNY